MIQMQMTKEHFVQLIQRHFKGIQAFKGTFTHIENEFVAIPQFDQEAGRGLFESWNRHAGTASDNPHVISSSARTAEPWDP